METPHQEPQWERSVLERIALDAIAEQRRRRRWGIFFKLLGFIYLGVMLAYFIHWGGSAGTLGEAGRHTALIELDGTIEAQGQTNAENVISALKSAYADQGTRGVVLRINSPGGSPVQAGMINDEIWRQRALHPKIPVYAVVEDICASGAYYVAVATDKIYVDKASMVGSIGVLMNGFGFTGAMRKLGIERRLLTAGKNKGFLDPFSPQNPQQQAYAERMLEQIHQQFIAAVRKGRGKRLKQTPEMFSGLMWTGTQSIALGLADGYGTVGSVARDVIKAPAVQDYTVKQNLAEKFAKQIGADVSQSVTETLTRLRLQ